VKSVLDKAMEIQTRPDLQGEAHRTERGQLVRKLIGDNFMSAEMAQEAIKGHWNTISAAQRSEFQGLFIALFQESYTRMVLNFLQRETIEYRGESSEGKRKMVRTVIMRANEHIPVDYLVDVKGNRWLIRDVVIDGVSIVENYNNTFSRAIQTKGMADLLSKMQLQKKAVVGDTKP
jgi:phospholipid transport system substrate-binding protein